MLIDLGKGVWQFDMGIGLLNRVFGTILLEQYLVSDLDALTNYNRDISLVSWRTTATWTYPRLPNFACLRLPESP